jgi:hypothetical protein
VPARPALETAHHHPGTSDRGRTNERAARQCVFRGLPSSATVGPRRHRCAHSWHWGVRSSGRRRVLLGEDDRALRGRRQPSSDGRDWFVAHAFAGRSATARCDREVCSRGVGSFTLWVARRCLSATQTWCCQFKASLGGIRVPHQVRSKWLCLASLRGWSVRAHCDHGDYRRAPRGRSCVAAPKTGSGGGKACT